jgi:ATP-binding protein involved in chromosome partitioning
LKSRGATVGVLDADVWGFSIPRMFGLLDVHAETTDDNRLLPLERNGVRIISVGSLVPDESVGVAFRGPMLHKYLELFLARVVWGNLDYLVIDMPPGTGDVTLSLAGFLPGLTQIIVTTPQLVAQRVAERAASVSAKVRVPILGVVENMSQGVFGTGGGAALAERLGVPLLGVIPLSEALREAGDRGQPLVWSQSHDVAVSPFAGVADAVQAYRPRRRLPVNPDR